VEEINQRIKEFQATHLVPFLGARYPCCGKLGNMEQKILDEENLKLEDFMVPACLNLVAMAYAAPHASKYGTCLQRQLKMGF
jgi:hypothetical protein